MMPKGQIESIFAARFGVEGHIDFVVLVDFHLRECRFAFFLCKWIDLKQLPLE